MHCASISLVWYEGVPMCAKLHVCPKQLAALAIKEKKSETELLTAAENACIQIVDTFCNKHPLSGAYYAGTFVRCDRGK